MDPFITMTDKFGLRQGGMGRVVLLCLVCVLSFLFLLFWVYPAQAASWQDQERACMRTCPSMPRYSGIESEKQYKARMKQQAAFDRCFMNCARKSSAQQARTFVPIGEVEARYFKRNGSAAQ